MFLTAAWISALLAGIVVVFQLCLVFGAPWGEYALGGRVVGRLPARLRLASLAAAVVMAIITFHYLVMSGVFAPLFDSGVERVLNWVVVVVAAASLVMNWASKSKKERGLWVPFAGLMLLANLIVAANYAG